MVNTEHFAKRLEKILDYYDISAAGFAEAIDVGRSSISHILSGRNKPSLDFVLKVVHTFPEVEIYWLLNGKGSFPSSPDKAKAISPNSVTIPLTKSAEELEPKIGKPPKEISEFSNKAGQQIRKIVFFYDDGSFEAFEN